MIYTHRITSGINIIDIEDSMDLYSVPELKKLLKKVAQTKDIKILLVMQKVHFIDSSGLGMLTNLFFECQQKGIPLKVANLSPEVKKIFSLTKLDKSFHISETEEDAIRDFF